MTFTQFSDQLNQVESASARLVKTKLISELFKKLNKDEIAVSCYLMRGRLVPQYQSLEFQLSEKMVLRALARITTTKFGDSTNLFGEPAESVGLNQVTTIYKTNGDLGRTAETVVATIKTTSSLDLLTTFNSLVQIAHASGEGSQEKKLELLVGLLKRLSPLGARYVVRIVLGKMRLGFSTMTIIDALSWAAVGDKSESKLIEAAWQIKADIGQIAQDYLALINTTHEKRKELLKKTNVEVGIPIMPALCQRLNSTAEMIEKMGKVIVEPKYDGLRTQLHFKRGDRNNQSLVEVFTRSLENASHMFPEIQQLPNLLNCQSCILDAEAIGFNPQTGQFKAFQETITRKRKHGVLDQAAQIPIKFFVFDLLELNGRSLLNLPLIKRKQLLAKIFSDNQVLMHTPFHISDDPAFLSKYHRQLLEEGLEGAVMKKQNSRYIGGRKGWRWVKIKEIEGTQGKLKDTLDVIMMGYYLGKGKRAEFGLGAILTGILDANGEVVTIAKIGTGMTEEQLIKLKQLADKNFSPQKPDQYRSVDKSLTPDAWLNPSIVLEVAADEITTSPTHGAGVALRFPRLIKVRNDKLPEQATTINELKSIK